MSVVKIGKPAPYGAAPTTDTPVAAPATQSIPAATTPSRPGRPAPYSPQNIQPTKIQQVTQPSVNKSPVSHIQSASKSIQDMQRALIDLALDVSESDFASKTPKRRRELDEQGRYLGGGMPFAKYIVQQYMNPEQEGQQFLTAPQTARQRKELSQKDMELSGVISTIKTIGAMGKENKPDGVWGPRTTNSLVNISKFISAILSLTDDMGIQLKSYDKSRYSNLMKLINSNDHTPQVAEGIAKELMDVRKFYDEMKTTVFENPQYKSFIDQEKPFAQHDKMTNALSEQEQNLYNQNLTNAIPGLNLDIDDISLPVSLWDIASVENFKKFLNQSGIKNTTDDNIQIYIKMLTDKAAGL